MTNSKKIYYGYTGIGGGLLSNNVTKTTSYTIDTGTYPDYIILCNFTAAHTITLPAPTVGRTLIIKDGYGTAATYNITVARYGSENIDGYASNYTISANYGSLELISDGTNWFIKEYIVSPTPTYSQNYTTKQLAMKNWPPTQASQSITVGTTPYGACFDGTNIWVTNTGDNTVSKILANTGEVLGTYTVSPGGSPYGVCFDGTYIWVADYTGYLTKLNQNTGAVVSTYSGVVGNGGEILFDGYYIWVSDTGYSRVVKVSTSGVAIGYYTTAASPFGICFDGTYIWVANSGADNITKVLASTGAVIGTYNTNISTPRGVCFDGTYIWVANGGGTYSGTVVRYLASTGAYVGQYTVGTTPYGLCFDGVNIWVGNYGDGTVTKLLASTGAVLGTYSVGTNPYQICFDGTNIWCVLKSGSIVKLPSSETSGNPIAPIFTIGGDLKGTPSSQQVVSITGQAGTVNIGPNGNIITWDSTTTAPCIKQATPLSVTIPANLTITTQAPNGGSGSAAQNTPGSLIVNLPVPGAVGTAGNEAYFTLERGTTPQLAAGYFSTDSTEAIWLSSTPATTPSTSNYAIKSGNGSGSTSVSAWYTGSTGFLRLCNNDNAQMMINANATQIGYHLASTVGTGGVNVAGGIGVLGIADANTPPSGALTGGGVLYSSSGNLNWLNSAGTVVPLSTNTLSSPTIYDASVFKPTTVSPDTYNEIHSVIDGYQIPSSSSSACTVRTIPLPGTSGAPSTRGSLWIDCVAIMTSTTTAVGATIKFSLGWSTNSSGAPVAMGTVLPLLSAGTNSGLPPTSWAASIVLTGASYGSYNALVQVTGDGALTIDCSVQTEYRYVQ